MRIILGLILGALVISIQAQDYMRVCYYTNWAQYRRNGMEFVPEDVDPFLCTHIKFAFAQLNGNRLATYEYNDQEMYTRLNNLKFINTDLKTLLSVGGWNHGSERFSWMVASQENRTEFITSSIEYLRQWGFDGIDIDWEYPTQRGGVPEDRPRFTLLMQEARAAFNQEAAREGLDPLLLTGAFHANTETAQHCYEVAAVSREVDFLSVMGYDMQPQEETGHQSPLFESDHQSDYFKRLNWRYTAEWYIQQGAPRDKIVMGWAASGKSYTLADPENNRGMGAPITGRGIGEAAGNGTLFYYEICVKWDLEGATQSWHNQNRVPYGSWGDQWVGFENERSLEEKADYVKDQGLGGMMVWELAQDDFNDSICDEGEYPLISQMFWNLEILP